MLNDALVEGMRIVGIDFRDGILFVPEVLLAANAMKGGMEILRPLLAETGVEPIGKMVIGTVKGDIHDIGKNLVAMMMEGAGFEVIDLGINNPVEKYLAALDEHKPDILGLSALLTTTMPYMKVVIDTMKDEGIRDDYIVLVGGAPLNEAFGKAVGADAYCRDAAVAVETAKALIAARRAARVSDSRDLTTAPMDGQPRILVIACGALAREIAALRKANEWPHLDVRCLPRGIAQPAGAHRSPPCARPFARVATATRRSSSPTAIAAPAARSMRCCAKKTSSAFPAPIATNSSPAARRSRSSQTRSPARSTSPISCFAISTASSSAASASIAIRSSPRSTSATTAASSTSRRSTRRSGSPPRARPPNGSGSSSRTALRVTADWNAALRATRRTQCRAWQS